MKKYVIAATAVVLAAAPAHAAELIANGGFEAGTDPGSFTTLGVGSPNIANWTIGANTVDYIGSYWTGSDGGRSVDLAGNAYGTLSQAVNLIAGQAYRLTFFLSANPDYVPATDGEPAYPRQVSVAIGALGPTTFSYFGPNTRNAMNWQQQTYNFIAGATGSTNISFSALNAGTFYGPALDQVSLSAVPEPGTWLLMLAGFGIAGFAMRRRQNVRVSFA